MPASNVLCDGWADMGGCETKSRAIGVFVDIDGEGHVQQQDFLCANCALENMEEFYLNKDPNSEATISWRLFGSPKGRQ